MARVLRVYLSEYLRSHLKRCVPMSSRVSCGVFALLAGLIVLPVDLIRATPATSMQLLSQALPLQRPTYRTQGIIFETLPGFSDLQSLGGDTVGVVFPLGASPAHRVTVRMIVLDPNDLGVVRLGDRELAQYVRYRYFGLTDTATSPKVRRFMAQDVTGETLVQRQNGGLVYLEFYVVPLPQDRQLAIAFAADSELPVALLEQTIQSVATSLRPDPTFKYKRRK